MPQINQKPSDIRLYKNEIRNSIKQERREMDKAVKAQFDESITKNVRKLYQYRSAKTILIYMSTEIEISTVKIIENAWADGKKVAVPRCIPDTRLMEFHYIESFDELSAGAFSVLEPSPEAPMVTEFDKCLMILPALSLDYLGYRLGYGKGYYDRYLSRFIGPCAAICYSHNIRRHMFHGRYDRPVDVIVTEKWIKDASQKRNRERKNFLNRS